MNIGAGAHAVHAPARNSPLSGQGWHCKEGGRFLLGIAGCASPLARRVIRCSTPLQHEERSVGRSAFGDRCWGQRSSPRLVQRPLEQRVRAQPASLAVPPSQLQPLSLWQKLVPLAVIFFCASFNLTLLANLKDAIMVTAGGAETLPFLASCGVLPASLAFFVLYGRILDLHLQRSMVFLLTVAPLVAFYVGFALFLFPSADLLHPHGLFAALAPSVPIGLHGLLKVVENWTFSLFFCVAELWGAVVISVLFWTLANEVCTVKEAKGIYPLLGIAANVALVAAGNFMKLVNVRLAGSELACLRVLVGTVVAFTGVIYAAELFVERRVAVACFIDPTAGGKAKPKRKGSLADAVQVLRESPMIFALALMVISYGVGHRLFEFSWKGMLRISHPSTMAYQGVLADVSIATGYMTIGAMLAGRFVFQRLGWAPAAFVTPTVLLVFGGAFFGFSLSGLPAAASWAVLAGAITQVCARSSKFALFDPAKEMAYIQMSRAEKSKGKAAVDLIGSQVGKSGASWITQALLLLCGSISGAMPLTAAIFGAVVTSFFFAVSGLHREMAANERRKAEAETAAAAKAEAASSPAAGSTEAAHAQSLLAAHANGVYRVAPSVTPEVTGAEHDGAHLNGSPSGAGSNRANPGGVAAAQPNVRMHCCQVAARRRLCSPFRWGL